VWRRAEDSAPRVDDDKEFSDHRKLNHGVRPSSSSPADPILKPECKIEQLNGFMLSSDVITLTCQGAWKLKWREHTVFERHFVELEGCIEVERIFGR
jgi:hypothetical protein